MSDMRSSLSGLTFLVVDDEPDNVGVVLRLLTMMGAGVITAENGQEGLEKARLHRPDVIFADLSMPVMTGWQMLYEIKHNPDLERTPVIALTAHAMSGDRERVLSAGFAGYIAKPIDVPVFMPTIVTMLHGFTELKSHFQVEVREIS